jgi:glutamine synthetase
MLSDGTLRQMISDGSIDTVVVCFPDMQGRPVGKRVTAAFFLEHVLEHGIEACDYLLALDVDMEPLAGYRFANWDGGYGDMVARPDMSTLRRLPWLEGTALVVCDLVGTDGAPSNAPPNSSSSFFASRSKKQRPRAGATCTPTPPPSRTISYCRRRVRSTSSGGSATK